jgi:prephenate dehydrogenase
MISPYFLRVLCGEIRGTVLNEKKPVVAIVGTGLIGCSVALAVKGSGYCNKILGFSKTAETLEQARQCGAVDIKLISLRDAALADVIVLCAPASAIVSGLHQLGATDSRSKLVIDTGSIKAPIVKAAVEAGLGAVFVGGHPMAGSQKSGPAAARADLFRDKTFFLVPTSETSAEALETAQELVKALGAVAVEIDAQEHDRTVALTSHLPYLLASALSGLADEQSKNLTSVRNALAGGFRDLTRLADGSPEMWADIITGNSINVKEWLQKLIEKAESIMDVAENPDKLKEILHALRKSHHKLLE